MHSQGRVSPPVVPGVVSDTYAGGYDQRERRIQVHKHFLLFLCRQMKCEAGGIKPGGLGSVHPGLSASLLQPATKDLTQPKTAGS